MQCKYFIFSFLLLLVFSASSGQNIISRIKHKDPNLKIYTDQNRGRFTIAGVIDKNTHVCFLISRYGTLIDSVHITDDDYALIEKSKSNPFKYYNALCDKIVHIVDTGELQLRAYGKLNPQWQYAPFLSDYVDGIKKAGGLQKIIVLEGVSENYIFRKWLVNTYDPKYFKEDTLYKSDNVKPGAIIVKGDTTLYYNKDNFVSIYKAMLLFKEEKILYYDRNNALIDSLKFSRYLSENLKQKIDVFFFYRDWLERQRNWLEEKIKDIDTTKASHSSNIQFASQKPNTEQLDYEARQELRKTMGDLRLISEPDPKAIATFYHRKYKNVPDDVSLFDALDIVYNPITTYYCGQKEYEITNHKGDVVATISDKKTSVDVNHDGFIDYYLANVLTESDYAPFGSGLINRIFSTKINYRFGYNGQEKDNEIYGVDNAYAFKYRIDDSRTGRFWSIDPLFAKYPWNSSYTFAENKLGLGKELEGLEIIEFMIATDDIPVTKLVVETAVKTTADVSTSTSRPPAFTESIQKGLTTEAEQLAKNGLTKNTKPIEVTNESGGKTTTIPDALKNGGKSTSEVKNVKYQSRTSQLKAQEKFSNNNGLKPELIINQGAKISKPLQNSSFDFKYYGTSPPLGPVAPTNSTTPASSNVPK